MSDDNICFQKAMWYSLLADLNPRRSWILRVLGARIDTGVEVAATYNEVSDFEHLDTFLQLVKNTRSPRYHTGESIYDVLWRCLVGDTLVLRPRDGGRYWLVGEAYVHSAMEGEFMDTAT
jgi:hypothetical protein